MCFVFARWCGSSVVSVRLALERYAAVGRRTYRGVRGRIVRTPSQWKRITWVSAILCASLAFLPVLGWTQHYTKSDRDFAQQMLHDVAEDVRKYYFDTKLHGVDWEARFREAKKNVDAADSLDNAVSEIAALLDTLNDSHTLFSPPPRKYVHEYGFTMEMIGDRCFVTRVRSGSDAEKKGLSPGDQVAAVNEHPISRKTFWRIHYIYDVLRPQPGLQLTLVDEAGHQRQLEVMAQVRPSKVTKYFLHQGINEYVRDLVGHGSEFGTKGF